MQTLSIWLGGKYSVTKKVVRLIFFLSKFQIKELFETALHKRTTQCALKQFEEEEEQFDMLTIHEAYQWLSRKYIDDDLAKNTGIYLGWMQIVTIFQKCKSIWRSVSLKFLKKGSKIRVGNETKKIFALFLQWPTKELPNWPLKKSMPNLKRMIWQLWKNPGEVVMQLWDQLLENRVFHQGANLGKK